MTSRPSRIIDAHIHIYDTTREGLPWPSPGDDILYHTFKMDEFRKATKGIDAEMKTIVIECSPRYEDNLWTFEQIENDPDVLAYIANLDPLDSDFEVRLKGFEVFAKFRGLRFNNSLLQDPVPEIRVALQALERSSAPVLDVLGSWKEMDGLADIARTYSGLNFVVDHFAGVSLDGDELPSGYQEFLQKLAETPNVYMKGSSLLGRKASTSTDSSQVLLKLFEAVCGTFSIDRIIFGSDWPVIRLKASYDENYEATMTVCAGLSAEELNKIMWANAMRTYQVEDPTE